MVNADRTKDTVSVYPQGPSLAIFVADPLHVLTSSSSFSLLAEVEGAPDEPDQTVRGTGAAFNREADNIAQRVFG